MGPDNRFDEVKAVNEKFYRAFEALDIVEMEEVWLTEEHVKCIHPGWNVVAGWSKVRESWEGIFITTQAIHITLTDIEVRLYNNIAWVNLTENVISMTGDEKYGGTLVATNLYENVDEEWKMILHHASDFSALPPTLTDSIGEPAFLTT